MRRRSLLALVIVSLSVAAYVPASANMLVNGDFESPLNNGWLLWAAPDATGIAQTQPTTVYAGSGSLRITALTGSIGVAQAINTIPGHQYQVTGRWKGDNYLLFSNGFLFFNGDGRPWLDQATAPVPSATLATVWNAGLNSENPPFSFPWKDPFDGTQWYQSGPHTNIIAATGNKMYVVLGAYGAGEFGFANAYFDNISVEDVTRPIPEPSSFLALGGGFLALAGIIRRKHG